MNDARKRGIRDIYWDLGLSIKWLKMSVIKLRKHRESISFQFLTNVKMSVACGIVWVENQRPLLDMLSLRCLVDIQGVVFCT